MKTLMSALLLVVTVSANADTLFARLDGRDGGEPSYTLGMLSDDGLAAWAIGLPSSPILMAGYSHRYQLNPQTSLTGVGYLARFTALDQWYLEPAAVLLGSAGDFRYKLFGGFYAPLNGGPWRGYIDQGNVTFAVSPDLGLGLGTSARFTEGQKSSFGLGPVVTWRTGQLSLSARWLAGVNQPNSFRMEVSTPF